MRVRFKKCADNAKTPKYASEDDACLNLFASSLQIDDFGNLTYDTGIAFEIPKDHVGLVFPRSSVFKKTLILKNSVGVIDSGYRGTIQVKFSSLRESNVIYDVGDRVAQIMIIPRPSVELEEVDELSDSTRGTGGFGSTGS